MDMISQLPDHVLHSILSHLSTKQACQCRVISKSWLQAWESFPVLDFNQGEFRKELPQYSWQTFSSADKDKPAIRDALDKFMKYVDASMKRFVKKKLRMKRFKIFMSLIDSNPVRAMDRWIELAVHSSIEDLNLSFVRTRPTLPYTLPQILLSATSLKALSLCGCKLDDLALSMKFPSLKKLSLERVHLNDRILHSLVASCPRIEDLELMSCKGLENLHISGLECLRRAKMEAFSKFKKVYIEGQNLENFECACTVRYQQKLSSSLRELRFSEVNITDQGLYDIMNGSPYIETLYFRSCNMLRRLKISSDKLSKLELIFCNELVETKIDALNLQNFRYLGNPISFILQTSPSCSGFMSLRGFNIEDWIKFLTTSSIQLEKLTISVHFFPEEMPRGLGKFSRPLVGWKIEHLELLNVSIVSSTYAAYLDGLLWSCKPKILSTTRGQAGTKCFIKFLHKSLGSPTRGCSRSYPLSCWKHCLLGVEMINSSSQPYRWDELTDLLPKLSIFDKIYFRLQWGGSHVCHHKFTKLG